MTFFAPPGGIKFSVSLPDQYHLFAPIKIFHANAIKIDARGKRAQVDALHMPAGRVKLIRQCGDLAAEKIVKRQLHPATLLDAETDLRGWVERIGPAEMDAAQ